jgi:D-threo-aldose 1-dehydrogenase
MIFSSLEYQMDGIFLFSDSLSVSRMGFGSGSLMRVASRRERLRLLGAAFDAGITHFDVAPVYGLGVAERELGFFARGRRDQMTIATKFGLTTTPAVRLSARLQTPLSRLIARSPTLSKQAQSRSSTLYRHQYDVSTARASLQESLRNLQTNHVDILFLHDPAPGDTVPVLELCAFLEDAKRAGDVRAWGVSGEPDPCAELCDSLPSPALPQLRDDILLRTRQAVPRDHPSLVFGAISGALASILSHIKRSGRRWSDRVGADCTDPETIASLLLMDAFDTHRQSVVLFNSTHAERIRRGAEIARAGTERGTPSLAAFRALVREELAPSPRAVESRLHDAE